jgi:L-histidine N-alpha-methyltransferase
MATYLQAVDLEPVVTADVREALTGEVRRGLAVRPRTLSPWIFYDAEGSRLFERITVLPEYYPTRTERAILAGHADAMVAAAHRDRSLPLRLVELGAGTASKSCILLEAALRLSEDVTYVPVDVCPNALELACQNIACALPEVRIHPIVRNYVTHPLRLDSFDGTTLALCIGTSIGNFSPQEARLILQNLHAQLQGGDALLLGTDMVKDEATLLAAYDDNIGVTAAFNLNILHRLNRELGADFDTTCFRHRVRWNSVESRIEMHLESTREQDVRIEDADLCLHFTKHETIHTENSYKFTDQGIRSLLNGVGFAVREEWKDSRDWYAVTLARLR